MALDAILLSGIIAELRPKIIGARIDKVQQPERDKIVLSVRGAESLRLLIDAGAGSGRLQQTRLSFENPAEPPMFCMLLRKYLTGGRIEAIEQPDWERLAIVNITSRNELGDNVDLRLAVELMGRSSNLVLIGSDGRIIDCLRRMDYGGDVERRMLPGMIYRLPPKQRKPLVFKLSQEEIAQTLSTSDAGKSADKRIMDCFSGLSPLICRELACRSGGDNAALLPEAIDAFLDSVRAGELTPVLFTEDGKPKEFSFMQLRQYAGVYETREFESFSELLDAYYSKRDTLERRRRRSRELSHHVKTARDRIARKLGLQRQELQKCSERDEIRRSAELLTANLYRAHKGDSSVTVEDYYEPDCQQRTIKLNPLKTPQNNAAAMFKEYNKLKTAEQHLTVLIYEGERQLEYLNSVLDETERAETEDDLAEIKAELVGTGYIKKQRSSKERRRKKQGPMRFVSSDGFEILVGRSNAQNDELTTKTARRTDIWLHTKTVHGSHVIISCDGLTPPEKTIEEAAQLAVYYSQARDGGKTQVDYTMVRNVRKPSGSLPGKVIYTDYSTLSVSADEALAEKLRVK